MYEKNGYIIHDNFKEFNIDMLGGLMYNKSKSVKTCYYENMGGIDTESSTISEIVKDKHGKEKENVLHCFCYMYQLSIGKHIFLLRTENEFKLLLQSMLHKPKFETTIDGEKVKTKKARILLFCANFSHEFAFLKNMFDEIGITSAFAKTERNILFIELRGRIEIRECIGLFGGSLSDIAKQHTITQKLKGDLDYNLIRIGTPDYITPLTETETNYCINDVAILSELMPTIKETFLNENMRIAYTQTGIIRQQTRKRAGKRIKFIIQDNNKLIPNETYFDTVRNFGYNGGLCGSNAYKVGEQLHNVFCYDITSDYPFQMNTRLFPAGECKIIAPTEKNFAWIIQNKYMFYGVFRFAEIKAKSIHGSINIDKIKNKDTAHLIKTCNGKLLHGKNVVIVLNDVDFETFKMMYNAVGNVNIESLSYFTKKQKAPKHLRDNINYWYKLKAQLKQQIKDREKYLERLHIDKKHDEILKDLNKRYKQSKQYVNAHYGMCATRPYKENLDYNTKIHDFIISKNNFDKLRENIWLNPYIAYYTTSYARQMLCKYISKYPNIIVQYDTDSIYFLKAENYKDLISEIENENKQTIENNKKHFDRDLYQYCYDMGTWDLDKCYTDFLCLGSKRYIKTYGDKTECVIAGLPKDTLEKWTHENGVEKSKDDIYKFVGRAVSDSIKFSHNVCGKLASKYYDSDTYKTVLITDYLGNSGVVTYSGYHALLKIGFEFTMHDTIKAIHNKREYENNYNVTRETL